MKPRQRSIGSRLQASSSDGRFFFLAERKVGCVERKKRPEKRKRTWTKDMAVGKEKNKNHQVFPGRNQR